MRPEAAGVYRRTQAERDDQWLSWNRTDQAFFASGACHILAWACREAYPERAVGIAAMRFVGEARAFHAYATWGSWSFDHSGWNAEPDLLAVNSDFEGRRIERFEVRSGLASFCQDHYSRMPADYWEDPRRRARSYVRRFEPPWLGVEPVLDDPGRSDPQDLA
ncbi:hypothetical protein GCM10007979_24760 [Nocardioides albus]|uniref:Uncharacterized protein n=1 Tax=Nocardioides albus TaxID=1841 RepID=A0A7W5A6M8_9ACTN|nr:hypothetical protein [Nocardioides albus]GGU24994.1 hypothetical protein GCM10007979_24760 [Nocardioides albus]